MKILVVDDEQLLVKGMKFNLENEGYTVDRLRRRDRHRHGEKRRV